MLFVHSKEWHGDVVTSIHTRFVPIPIIMLMKIIAANNLHILLLCVTNVLQINNILQRPTLSVYINIINISKHARRCTSTI